MINDDANLIRANLENQFKQLIPDENAPEELKREVFDTIDTLNLLGDLVDLFTAKFTQVETSFLDLAQGEDVQE